jgi:hypothetical protein
MMAIEDGTDSGRSAADSDAKQAPPTGRRVRSFLKGGRWILTTALGAAIALGVAALAGQLGHPESLAQQLDDILGDADRDRLEVIYNRELDLHGNGVPARILVLRPRIASSYRRSDELRVYEQDDERLRLAFTLRPARVARRRTSPDRGLVYRINLVAAGKLDGSDRIEVALVLMPDYADTNLLRPFVLTWDASNQSYAVRALLRHPPRIPRSVGSWATGIRRLYRPVDVPLVGGTTLRRLGGAQRVAIRRGVLATAYTVRQSCNACRGTWGFETWCLNFSYSEPVPIARRPRLARVRNGNEIDRRLEEALGVDTVFCG